MFPDGNLKMHPRKLRATIIGLTIGLAVILGLTQFSSLEFKDYITQIIDVDPILFLNILCLTILFMVTAARRWGLSLLPFADKRPPQFLFLLHYSNLGILLGQFINTWGTAGVKAIALHVKFQYQLRQIAIAAVIELLASNLPNVLLAGVALVYFFFFTDFLDSEQIGQFLMGLIASFLAITALVCTLYRMQRLRRTIGLPLLTRLRSARIYGPLKEVFSYDFLKRIPTGQLTGLSLLCVIINIIKTFLILRAFDIDIPSYALILAVCGLHFLTIVSLTPGGLGVYEAGFTGILVWFGAPIETAIVASIVKRILDDLSVISFYFAVLIYLRLKGKEGTVAKLENDP